MIAMSINTSTNLGGSVPGSFNTGIANNNAMGMWQNWQNVPQTQMQSGFSLGMAGQSFHNSGNGCECPICKGPTWAIGRVCEHCKTNVSRWRHLPLSIFGLDISDIHMLKTRLIQLESQEASFRKQQQESDLPDSRPVKRVVVKGFMRYIDI